MKEAARSFVCLDSLGTSNPETVRGYTISLDHNPYIKHLTETALSNPSAHQYDSTMFGPSPDAWGLERPPDIPWVLVPLVITGKLYGYIAADNAYSSREITSDSLEYMTLLGVLAAQVIANSEMIEMLGTRNLPIFSRQVEGDESESRILRRLLVYLTAGETLGFSRALFLKLDDRSQSFVYTAGLGSVTHDRFTQVTQKAQEEGMQRLLDRLDRLNDADLDNAMRGFQINAEEPRVKELLRDMTAHQFSSVPEFSWPEWTKDLAYRIDANNFLVGPVRTENKVLGLFIVDRQWQGRTLNDTDRTALETFARLAAANIVIFESDWQRTKILEAIQKILTQMQTELSLEKNLRLILQGVQEAGFDRARVFRFKDDTQSFVCLDSLGLEGREVPSLFRGQTIYLDHSPYTKHTVETALQTPKARKYDPTIFGPSPYTESLGRDLAPPWAVVPLVISGKLYGQITADNTPTRREITTESLEYMTLLGALAAQTIANAETIEMLRASKLKDEFLQRMAHIFGSTVSGVAMLVQNLKDGIVDSERALREYIPVIAKMNERFLGLAQNIIDFAALREDTKLNVASVDLTTLVEDAIDRLRVPAQERGIHFELSFPQRSDRLDLDPVRTGNAIEALLDNAIKFSPASGVIHVQLQARDRQMKLVIRDEGLGIPDEDLRFVFDSFYRGHNARDAHVDGTGLGLSIVAQTMRLQGGRSDGAESSRRRSRIHVDFSQNIVGKGHGCD